MDTDEEPNWLKWLKRPISTECRPTIEELYRAATAPHDADAKFLRYLSVRPEFVRLLENMEEKERAEQPPGEWKPEPMMERISEELRKRERQGEKGGELSL